MPHERNDWLRHLITINLEDTNSIFELPLSGSLSLLVLFIIFLYKTMMECSILWLDYGLIKGLLKLFIPCRRYLFTQRVVDLIKLISFEISNCDNFFITIQLCHQIWSLKLIITMTRSFSRIHQHLISSLIYLIIEPICFPIGEMIYSGFSIRKIGLFSFGASQSCSPLCFQRRRSRKRRRSSIQKIHFYLWNKYGTSGDGRSCKYAIH